MTAAPRYLLDLGFEDAADLVRAAGGADRAAALLGQPAAWVADVVAARRPLPAWAVKCLLRSARGEDVFEPGDAAEAGVSAQTA